MKIQSMFQKDINRDINGVIKVAQDDEGSLKQELGEYIITKELRRHFSTFFGNYSKSLDVPTDKTGVWISGFFGSGKSHFLKILSYLLSNREVGGERPIDIFKDKFDDPMMYASASRCAGVPTESILFNIDVEGPSEKTSTAVLRVFTKVFYNHLGYYGNDLKVAKLERFLDKRGKAEAFREEFEKINGGSWLENRDSFAFLEDDIVKVLQSAAGMSETAARNWFNGEESADMSIEQLVSEIKEYADGKGKANFRLLFMVDEVGQYIGDDGNLMLNLQSIVEELGAKCLGKVWVMVTSQEAIDSVVKISGDDFSKIQGRFGTRLSLSSSSVGEVIKKRILAKTEDADRLLRMVYEKERAVLKNLFTFNNPILDIKGYSDDGDFSATYPFVPYQFIVIQKVLAEIRKHGNAGKHLSGGERSMLSGFQEASQKIQEKDENALVPFHQFYDTVHTFLESPIRRVIDRCQAAAENRDGLEPRDADVLKLLYLVKYIEDVKANIDNIAVLMIDDIRADKIALRESIAASLERLLIQNYIARNGEVYSFLTDEEQEIAIDIRKTPVDSTAILQSIGQTVFSDLYPSKKFRLGKYDFAYDAYIDGTPIGTPAGGIRLRLLTAASGYTPASDRQLRLESHTNSEAAVLLSGADESPYFEELEEAAKIRKYVKQRNVSQLPESLRKIVQNWNEQARALEERAKVSIEKAIQKAAFYVYGEKTEPKGSAKEKLDSALEQLVESVYSKLGMVNVFADSDADIFGILSAGAVLGDADGTNMENGEALREISQWLEAQSQSMRPVTMGDVQRRYGGIPYGWREIDIAALAARLIAEQKISIKYGGAVVARDDRKLADYLRKKTEVDKAAVTRRIAPSEDLMRKSAAFLRNYLNVMDIPEDEEGLTRFVVGTFEKKAEQCQKLLENEYGRERYPQKETVTAARDLANDILSRRKDSSALLNRLIQRQDDLKDSAEDMEDVENFFKTQREIFDAGRKLLRGLEGERDYFAPGSETSAKLDEITAILESPKPYGRIKDLTELAQGVRADYGELLERKKEEVRDVVTRCMGDVHTLGGTALGGAAGHPRETIEKADGHFRKKEQEAAQAKSLTALDAMITQLQGFKDSVCLRIEAIEREEREKTKPGINGGGDGEKQEPIKMAAMHRHDLFPVRSLRSREEADRYIDAIRERLYEALETGGGIQIN